MNNLTGSNFFKAAKPKFTNTFTSQTGDFRSSSAYDQRFHSVGKRVGYDDKLQTGMPKVLKTKVNVGNYDIVRYINLIS